MTDMLKWVQDHVKKEYEAFSYGESGVMKSESEWNPIHLMKKGDLSEGEILPIEIMKIDEIEQKRDEFFELGKKEIKSGKLAAVLLAGGQGTRLGTDAPKGTYNIGITRKLSIFELLMSHLKQAADACEANPPLFIMTSEKNDKDTRQFFKEHAYFGYSKDKIHFFVQKTAPCVDFSGKPLYEAEGRIARSPNGNGGWYSSLKEAKILEKFPEIEWYNVFSVDNVLQKIADPVFLGATILSGANCGVKGVTKTCPDEKVGVLCKRGGLPDVIEYYDLPEDLAAKRDSTGKLVYSFGVTLNYLFRAEKLEEVAQTPLPVHVVKKKIPYLNEMGVLVTPETENGYKFETLILDLVRLMGSCLPFEVVREKEFAPVKNRTGVDSVDTARDLLRSNGIFL